MMEDWEPTAQAVIEGVRKAATMWPDRRYAKPVSPGVHHTEEGEARYRMWPMSNRCEYHKDRFGVGRDHACIVGAALYDMGFDPGTKIEEATDASGFIGVFGIQYADEPAEEGLWLNRVQFHQDNGMRWSDAVATADTEIEAYRAGEYCGDV